MGSKFSFKKALNLRKAHKPVRLDTIPNIPFSVYNKTVTCFEVKEWVKKE